MALLLVTVVLLTLLQIGQILLMGTDILENKQPSRMYVQQIISGVRHSNMTLQNYLLTGDNEFKNKLPRIWNKEIQASKDSVQQLLATWDDQESLVQYEKLSVLTERIERAQTKLAEQATSTEQAVTIDVYNYPDVLGDTVIGINELQMWIDTSLNEQASAEGAGSSESLSKLHELNAELHELAATLYKRLEENSEEFGEEIFAKRTQFVIIESIIVIGSLFLCFFLFRFVYHKINNSVAVLKKEVNILSAGDIPDGRKYTNDELDKVLEEIDKLSKNLSDVKSFALEVGKGKFDNDITVFNNEGEIGQSLAEMRESLKKVSEEAKIRNWSNKGFAELGDILRKYSSDLSELSDHVITYLVNYTDSNQGSLFILEENESGEKMLHLKASYAYDRKKYIEKSIGIGQGLVGQAFIEEESIYLKEIPENYVTITSGLGKATPKSIFIVPLIVNEAVYGVLELGSFTDYNEEKRDFLESISENIASSMQSVKVNERTNSLLEESQQMTEEMRAQEEEMRQNMEELQATQEEMERAQTESQQRMAAIENSKLCYVEFSPEGIIQHADESFLKLFGYAQEDEIRGSHHSIFVEASYANTDEYKAFWQKLGKDGINISGQFRRITKTGNIIYIKGAYSVLRDDNGRIIKVIKFASDVTELVHQIEADKAQKEKLLSEIEALKSALDKAPPAASKGQDLLALKKYNEDLSKTLETRLTKNENALKASLDKQKKDLGL